MDSYFTASFFSGNRTRLRGLCEADAPIVIAANGRMQKSADINFPFQQDSNFWYLTGIDEPEAVLVIDTDETYLIMPAMTDYLSYFYGQMHEDALQKVSGIDAIYDEEKGWRKLRTRLRKVKKAYTISPPPDYLDVYNMYTNPTRRVLVERISEADAKTEVIDVRSHLMAMRMVKQKCELQTLQAAVDLTVQAFTDIKGQKFTTEKELEAAFSVYFLQHGQRDHAYEPIVASGKNACLMHTSSTRQKLEKSNLVLMDIGAAVDGYAADITRVFAISAPSKRQREVYAAVLTVHSFALGLVKPGVSIRANEKQIEAYMGEQLMQLGLIKKPEREAIRHYFPHATSHFLGRDVHDLGDYDAPLAENMVLTIEPGIYIPEEGIGIRIEDDILVTKNGCRIMSDALPRDRI